MGGLFGGKPKMPEPVKPAPLPVVDETALNRNNADMLLKRRGRAATDLTQGTAAIGQSAASKTLLGS